MSSEYNLDDNATESFEFILGGFKYKMRYPNTEEIERASKLKDDEQSQWTYSFISPIDEAAPSISDAMKTATIPKLRNFTKMIEAEFGMGDKN